MTRQELIDLLDNQLNPHYFAMPSAYGPDWILLNSRVSKDCIYYLHIAEFISVEDVLLRLKLSQDYHSDDAWHTAQKRLGKE